MRHCDEVGPEDGVDSKELEKQRRRDELIARATSPAQSRKALQLCRQIQRTLDYVLSELGDDLPLSGYVSQVTPAPHTHHLLAVVTLDQIVDQDELNRLQQVLLASKGLIRAEVARSIHRRKTPDISFRVVNPT